MRKYEYEFNKKKLLKTDMKQLKDMESSPNFASNIK